MTILFCSLALGRILEMRRAQALKLTMMAQAKERVEAIDHTLTVFGIQDRQINSWLNEAGNSRTVRGVMVLLSAVENRIEDTKAFRRMIVDEML